MAAAWAVALVAVATSSTATRAQEEEGTVLRQRLDNGLNVVLAPRSSAPRVAVAVGYAAGSGAAPEGYAGLPRLVEHLTFWGSRHLAPQAGTRMLEALGARSNATTGPEHTTYFALAPAGALERILWLEADRMAFALDGVNERALSVEQRVVTRELASSGALPQALRRWRQRALYGEAHPFAPSPTVADDVRAASVENVQWFFQRTHRPDMATLAIAGRFEVGEARAWVARYFGSIAAPGLEPLRVSAPMPRLCGVHRSRMAHNRLLSPRLRVTWVLDAAESALDELALEVAAIQLRRRLREQLVDGALAESVTVVVERYATHALLDAQVQLDLDAHVQRERGALEEVERQVAAAAQELADERLSAEAFTDLLEAVAASDRLVVGPLRRARALATGGRDPLAMLRAADRLEPHHVQRAMTMTQRGRFVQTARQDRRVRRLVERGRSNPCR